MKVVCLWLTALLTVSKWDGTYGQKVRSLTLPPFSSQGRESLELCERVNLHCPFEGELPSWLFTPYVSDIPIYTIHGNDTAKHSVAQIINRTVLQIVADPAVLYSVSVFECGYKNAHRRISLSIQGNCAANSVNNWPNNSSTFSLNNNTTKLPIALNSKVSITCSPSSRLETATTVWQLFTRDCDDCKVWSSNVTTHELDKNLLSLSNNQQTLTLRGNPFFNGAKLWCTTKNATREIRSSMAELVIQGNESRCCPPQTNSVSTAASSISTAARLLTTILPTISLPDTRRAKTPVPFSVPTKATIAPTLLSYSFSQISTSKRENPVSTAAVSWTPRLTTTSALLSTSKLPSSMPTISTAASVLRTRTSPLAVTTTLSASTTVKDSGLLTPTGVIVIPSSAHTPSATFTSTTTTERTTSPPAKDSHTDGWIYAVIAVFCVLFLLGIIVLIAVVVHVKGKRKGKLEITRVVRLSLPPDPAVTNMFSLVSEMSNLPPTSNENGRSEATRAEASAKGESVQNKETTKEDTPPWNPPRPHYNVVRTASAKSGIKAEETKPTTYHPVLVSLASKSKFELDPAFQPKVDSKTDEEERNPVVLETDDKDTAQPVPSAVLDELDKITEAFMQTASDFDAQPEEPTYAKVIKVKPNTEYANIGHASSTEGGTPLAKQDSVEYDTLNPIQPSPRIEYEIAEEWL
ncbi:eukaryotic translation initiation factor 4 gamma-like isoform X2 [Oscarella lobularis]|uniref:eukaryotic translation initiation factor 4 gamma-like isoform X2 n=1 Tax=Oscarella lobularis TaxID=121494 RepID=UPI0033142ED5